MLGPASFGLLSAEKRAELASLLPESDRPEERWAAALRSEQFGEAVRAQSG